MQTLLCSEYEILLISDEPLQSVFELTEELHLSQARVLVTRSRGVNHSRNLGLTQARGKFVYFLDDDCELLNPNTLALGLKFLLGHERLAGVGGDYILPADANTIERVYHAISANWFSQQRVRVMEYAGAPLKERGLTAIPVRAGHNTNLDSETNQLYGGNAFYNKQAIGDLCFDPRIVFGGAEEEFNLQVLKKNLRLAYVAEMSVQHNLRMGLKDLFRKAYLQGFWYSDRVTRYPELLHNTAALVSPADKGMFSVLHLLYQLIFYWGRIVQQGDGSPWPVFKITCQTLWLYVVRIYFSHLWKPLRTANFPFRKILYMSRYQYETRLKRFTR